MTEGPADWNDVARTKLVKVFGVAEGQTVQRRALKRLGLETLSSADDLYRFSRTLSRDADPVAAAVGGLLGVTALLRGAVGD